MGSKFVEKHQRKSVLAALLFVFQGKAKYVGVMLLVICSIPFVMSGETLNGIIELPGVAAFMRAVGFGGVVSSMNTKYSNDVLKAAIDKAAVDNVQTSFWARFLKSVNATMPPADGPSTLAMVRGGGDVFGPPVVKDNAKRGPGQVKGVVNEEERKRGEAPGEVDLKGMLAGVPGGPGGSEGGLYGDLMGEGLAGSYGGGSASASSSRTSLVGVGGRSAGMYSKVMSQSAANVPVPGAPSKVKTKKMGRVSGFSWKNVGYKTKNAKVDVKIGNKKPMFQLAETFAMTGIAAYNKDSAYEYQAAYVGTTYDGNDSNLNVMQTDAAAPSLPPDSSFAGDLMTGAMDYEQAGKECSQAQGINGAAMSSDGKQMTQIAESMGTPPSCCSSRVDSWNDDIRKIVYLCGDYNLNDAQLATACKSPTSQMDCSIYGKYKVNKCPWWKCFLAFLFACIFGGFLLLAGLGTALFGGNFLDPMKFMINLIAGGKAI